MKLGISILFVTDVQKSKTFYVDTLGINFMPEFSDEKFVMLKPSNDVIVGLQDLTTAEVNPNDFKTGASELGFEVESVDELWQNLINKGLTLKEPENKPFGRVFYTQDPDGHKLSFSDMLPRLKSWGSCGQAVNSIELSLSREANTLTQALFILGTMPSSPSFFINPKFFMFNVYIQNGLTWLSLTKLNETLSKNYFIMITCLLNYFKSFLSYIYGLTVVSEVLYPTNNSSLNSSLLAQAQIYWF